MKTLIGLASRYVRMQFRRSLLTSLGIILAVALIAAVGNLAESIRQTQIAQAVELSGSHHAQLRGLDEDQVAVLKRNISLSGVGVKAFLGGAVLEDRSFGINLEAWDEKAREFFGLSLLSGRFPEKPSEIAMEKWALEQLGIPVALGEEIEVAFEHGYVRGEEYESFSGRTTFTLVGILRDIPAAKATGFSLSLVALDAVREMLPEEHFSLDAFVQVRPGLPVRETIEGLRMALGVSGGDVHFNENLLMAVGDQSVSWPVVLLAVLTIVVSAAAIYSIFHISVLERIRQFGMLRCIGASPGQVGKVLFCEAVLLSFASIPIGLLVGIGSAVVLVRRVPLLADMAERVAVSIPVNLFAVAVGLLAVLLAVWHPARLAGKITPLEAVQPTRRVFTNRGGGKKLLSRHIHGLLGITGGLAYENLWRNRRRTWLTLFSMCLGVVMFITYSYYVTSSDASSILEEFIKGDYSLRADVRDPGSGYAQRVVEAAREIPGVARVIPTHMSIVKVLLDETQVTPDDREGLSGRPNAIFTDPESGKLQLYSMMYGYDSATLEESYADLIEGEIDVLAMKGGPVALVTREYAHGIEVSDIITVVHTVLEDGETVTRRQEFRVGGILGRVPISVGQYMHSPQLMLHESVWTAFTGSDLSKMVDVVVDPKADKEFVESRLTVLARAASKGTLLSYQEEMAKLEESKRQIDSLMYGLIAVVSVIGLFGIVNAITTNLITRTREFGTLRAVGMTVAQLRRMVRLEGAFYGIISAFWGAIVGSLLAYALFLLLRNNLSYLVWSVPWAAIGVSCFASILLGVVATVVPLRRVAAMDVVEAVRSVE